MPKINIYESDLTTAGGLDSSSNVVYVPGFVKYIKDPTKTTYLFNSISEFKEAFSNDKGNFEYITLGTVEREDSTGKKVTYTKCERSMQYALALLGIGLPVLFDLIDTSDGVQESWFEDRVDAELPNKLEKLIDKNNYNIKFITSGGYKNLGAIAKSMLNIAASRGDCTALIDHEESTEKFELGSKLNGIGSGKFGAMFTPWCTFQFSNHTSSDDDSQIFKLDEINMPGSLAYLLAFGTSVANNNANWLAAAGASRGIIPNLIAPLYKITEADIDEYQLSNVEYIGKAINPIANINPYGTIVWGNRTLHQGNSGLVASSFLNIRQLANDIKKTLYTACKSVTFEQNSDLLWVKFKSLMTPLLDQMQTGNGISGYKLTKKKSTKKATLTAVVRIYPIEAVEDFEITLELADESTDVTDNL